MDLGKPVAKGNTAELYLSGDKIIKLFHGGAPDGESAFEAEKQKYARSCGLLVPKVLDVTRINGRQAIVMEYIRGKTLGDKIKENPAEAEHFLKLSVEMQLKIHSTDAGPLELTTEKLSRQIKEARGLDTGCRSALLEKLASMPVEQKLCHGDCHVFNLVQSDHGIFILDWVDASSGNVRADACRSFLLYLQFSEELAELYLRLYCGASGLSKGEILAWAPVVAGARLSENVPAENAGRLLRIAKGS